MTGIVRCTKCGEVYEHIEVPAILDVILDKKTPIRFLPSGKGAIQTKTISYYGCPICYSGADKPVEPLSGHIWDAYCPKCHETTEMVEELIE